MVRTVQDLICPIRTVQTVVTNSVKTDRIFRLRPSLVLMGIKVPDIDLNFSGEDQPSAHLDVRDIFGEEYAFRAGTVGTVAAKTAYGFVKGYERDYGKFYRDAEVERLAQGAAGVKRTTGQHPGESLLFRTTWMSTILRLSSIQQMMSRLNGRPLTLTSTISMRTSSNSMYWDMMIRP